MAMNSPASCEHRRALDPFESHDTWPMVKCSSVFRCGVLYAAL
jgi:hypothetical protein